MTIAHRPEKPRERTAILTQADGSSLQLDTREGCADPTDWVLGDVAGWYTGSGVRRDIQPAYGHGSFMGPGFRDARYMTVHGKVHCSTTAERDWQERSIGGLFGDGRIGTLWVDDGETQLYTEVGLHGSPQVVKVGTKDLVFQIPLVSDTPYLYGEWREVTLFPPDFGVGFEFPPLERDLGKGPIVTFGTEVRETAYIWNDGNAPAAPVFTVVADSPSGFSVGFGGRRVTYPRPTFKNVPIEVDMAGAIRVQGRDQTHLVGERGWSVVDPRTMETPVLRFLAGGTGWATVAFRDTYI